METLLKEINLYSYDIFDTLVTRKVGTPVGIFALMQKKIKFKKNLPIDFKKNFQKIRVESEKFARDNAKKFYRQIEITFDDIYSYMQEKFKLSFDTVNYLKQLEIETEQENLVPIAENIEKVKQHVKQGDRVVLISDMYYSAEALHKLLSRIDIFFNDIKIYVSADYKLAKWDKSLFKKIKKEEGIEYKNWEHVGDNRLSDIKNAKDLGIKTEFYNNSELLPYERDILTEYPGNIDYQFLVGTARLTRLNGKNIKNRDKYDFGASFTGPFLYNYVSFVLKDCIKKGYKTIYFVARDGYIPKVIADIIIEKLNLNIQTKYIYGSRLAWGIPNEENYKDVIEKIFLDYPKQLSAEYIAYRTNVPAEFIKQKLNLKSEKYRFKTEEIEDFKSIILKDFEIKNTILTENSEKIKLLKEYLKQEIDLSENNIAFVEINGTGKTQDLLSENINNISQGSKVLTNSYYVFLYKNKILKNSKKIAYCKKPKPYQHTLELLTRAPEGQTLGYKKDNDKIIPVLEEIKKSALVDWGYDDYLQGIKDFVNNITILGKIFEDAWFCYFYFDYLTTKCNKQIAETIGSIPYLPIGNEINASEAVSKMKLIEYLYIQIAGKIPEKYWAFPYLSIMRSQSGLHSFLGKNRRLLESFDLWIKLKLFVELFRLKNEKIMFWGASLFLEDFIKKYKIMNPNILGIIDKSPSRQGQKIGKYTIYAPKKISELKPKKVILTIKNNNESIYKSLEKTFNKDFPNVKLEKNIFG